jgi:hypothetical protein
LEVEKGILANRFGNNHFTTENIELAKMQKGCRGQKQMLRRVGYIMAVVTIIKRGKADAEAGMKAQATMGCWLRIVVCCDSS